MCLILLAWQVDAAYPLVVAANRDEFFARPTAAAAPWPGMRVVAGRDLEAGGTWLGVAAGGRFAALTNFRDPERQLAGAPSRGALVADFLAGDEPPATYMRRVAPLAPRYNGFNLLVADRHELRYLSNCGDGERRLGPGIYGLSNHLLDTPWPKVARGKSALSEALVHLPDTERLFTLLRDDSTAADERLPRTGVSLEWERLLSAAFVRSSAYGTRSSTVVLGQQRDGFQLAERSFGPDGAETGRVTVCLPAGGMPTQVEPRVTSAPATDAEQSAPRR